MTETPPASSGRRLESTQPAHDVPLVSAKELVIHHLDRHHKLAEEEGRELQFGGTFGGALVTTGAFTMMSGAGGFRRKLATEEHEEVKRILSEANERELQFGGTFDGALVTTGSFSMMSAGGF